jgi:hypothetical protein
MISLSIVFFSERIVFLIINGAKISTKIKTLKQIRTLAPGRWKVLKIFPVIKSNSIEIPEV